MSEAPLTPDERAYHDALAEAVEAGVYGEEALRYADLMRDTLWFQRRTLHYALRDVGRAVTANVERSIRAMKRYVR